MPALIKRSLLFLFFVPLFPLTTQMPEQAPEMPIGIADHIRVGKSDRRLELLRKGAVIASFKIALGRNPQGDKERQGDMRTPEGRYVIDWRNPQSGYHLSLHISYPGQKDMARARQAGVDPGGDIMIHGQPNGYAMPASLLLQRIDWTFGCIAVTNADMEKIWAAVSDGTSIEILP